MQQIALVVDDSRVARMTLRKLLIAHDLKVIEIGSGEDALVYLKSDNVKPDIIFMDVMMGGMDGLTATLQIKTDENLKHIPVVVCTGHDTEIDREKSHEVGAVATLTKPPEAKALEAIIIELTQRMTVARQVEGAPFDTKQMMIELKAIVTHDLLPTMQQELRELAEKVSRQVANDITEHRIAGHLALLNNNEPVSAVDETQLLINLMNKIELDLLPRMHRDVGEMAENISRQIAADTAEKMVADQVRFSMDALLPALKAEVLTEAQRVTEDLAHSVAKHAVHDAVADSADKAVQNAAMESDLPRQIMTMLNNEGQAWLQRHEQEMFGSLMQHVEAKFPAIVRAYLDEHLTHIITPIAQSILEKTQVETKAHTDTFTKVSNDNFDLEALRQQVSMLKMAVIALGSVVLVLTIAMNV